MAGFPPDPRVYPDRVARTVHPFKEPRLARRTRRRPRLIESRLAELDAETRQLERALTSLGEGAPRVVVPVTRPKSVTAPPPPKRRGARKPKRNRRAARGQRGDELLAAIKTSRRPPSELARAIGVNPPQVHALIAKLRAEKLIARKGDGYALGAKADSQKRRAADSRHTSATPT